MRLCRIRIKRSEILYPSFHPASTLGSQVRATFTGANSGQGHVISSTLCLRPISCPELCICVCSCDLVEGREGKIWLLKLHQPQDNWVTQEHRQLSKASSQRLRNGSWKVLQETARIFNIQYSWPSPGWFHPPSSTCCLSWILLSIPFLLLVGESMPPSGSSETLTGGEGGIEDTWLNFLEF